MCYFLIFFEADVVVVLRFYVPSTAKVILRHDLGFESLIRKTREARDRTHDPWFTKISFVV